METEAIQFLASTAETCSFGGLQALNQVLELLVSSKEKKYEKKDISFEDWIRAIARNLRSTESNIFSIKGVFLFVTQYVPTLQNYLNTITFLMDAAGHLFETSKFNQDFAMNFTIKFYNTVVVAIADGVVVEFDESLCAWAEMLASFQGLQGEAFDENEPGVFSATRFNATMSTLWKIIGKHSSTCMYGLKEMVEKVNLVESSPTMSSYANFFAGAATKLRQENTVLSLLMNRARTSVHIPETLSFVLDTIAHVLRFASTNFKSVDSFFYFLATATSINDDASIRELSQEVQNFFKHFQTNQHTLDEYFWLAVHATWKIALDELVPKKGAQLLDNVDSVASASAGGAATQTNSNVAEEEAEAEAEADVTCSFDGLILLDDMMQAAVGSNRLELLEEDFNATINIFLSASVVHMSSCTYGLPSFAARVLRGLSVDESIAWSPPTFSKLVRGLASYSRRDNNIVSDMLQSPVSHMVVYSFTNYVYRIMPAVWMHLCVFLYQCESVGASISKAPNSIPAFFLDTVANAADFVNDFGDYTIFIQTMVNVANEKENKGLADMLQLILTAVPEGKDLYVGIMQVAWNFAAAAFAAKNAPLSSGTPHNAGTFLELLFLSSIPSNIFILLSISYIYITFCHGYSVCFF